MALNTVKILSKMGTREEREKREERSEERPERPEGKPEGIRELVRKRLLGSGAVAVGFAEAGPVAEEVVERYLEWLAAGKHAGMEYMERYLEIRRDPRLLLEGSRTVCSLAFSYHPSEERDPGLPHISHYAYGEDYHNVIKRRLAPIVEEIDEIYGSASRICVDSAPIFERWWGWKAGIGIVGDNGALITDRHGSEVFLAEVVTTLPIEPDSPRRGDCGHCGACRRNCPGGALGRGEKNIGERGIPDYQSGNTGESLNIDCRRCLSYLTIEHRGEWEGESLEVMRSEEGRGTLFGCDACVSICPHNRGIQATGIAEFGMTEFTREADAARVAAMTGGDFKRTLRGSAIFRARLAGLRRNSGLPEKPEQKLRF